MKLHFEDLLEMPTMTDILKFYEMFINISTEEFEKYFTDSLVKTDFYHHKDEIIQEIENRGFHVIFHGPCDMKALGPAFYCEHDAKHDTSNDPEHRQDKPFLPSTLDVMAGTSEFLFLGRKPENGKVCRDLWRMEIGPTKPQDGTLPDVNNAGTLRRVLYDRYYGDNYRSFINMKATNCLHGPLLNADAERESALVLNHMHKVALLQKYGCAMKVNMSEAIKDGKNGTSRPAGCISTLVSSFG